MAKGSDNPFPSILTVEGTVPASPSAGNQRLYLDSSDHKLKRVNSSGTITIIESATLTTVTANRTTNQTNITLNVWTDVLTIALTTGTWDVKGYFLWSNSAGTTQSCTCDLYDGTAEVASGFASAVTSFSHSVGCGTIYVASGSITMHMRANPTSGTNIILASVGNTGSANTACQLYATKIA